MDEKKEMERRRQQEKLEKEKADIQAHMEYMQRVREEKEKGKRAVNRFLF